MNGICKLPGKSFSRAEPCLPHTAQAGAKLLSASACIILADRSEGQAGAKKPSSGLTKIMCLF